MELWQALLLGLVEGLTEYLPVSSTGHLLLAERALALEKSAALDAYTICIQAGAVLAVLGLYRARVGQMARGLLGRDPDGLRLLLAVLIAFLPAAVVGLLGDDWIEAHLFGLWPVVGAWFAGGVAILVVARARRGLPHGRGFALEQLGWSGALGVGLLQCLALWPGTSRSLATIVGGVLVGLNLAAAVEFSFLLGLVTLSAATAYKLVSHGEAMRASFGFAALALGAGAAFVAAWVSVRWMVGYLNRHGLELFGYWRVALAALVALLLWQGVLAP